MASHERRRFIGHISETANKTPLRRLVWAVGLVATIVVAIATFRDERWIHNSALAAVLLGYLTFLYICWRRDRRAAESEDCQ